MPDYMMPVNWTQPEKKKFLFKQCDMRRAKTQP